MYHDAHGRTMERMPWAYYVTHGGTVLEEVASFRPLESIVRLLDDERLSLCHRAVCVACCGPVVSIPSRHFPGSVGMTSFSD